MSLVGPRPERPCFVEDLKREIPRYALRHKMKAGMTGWAQVHGMRGNTCIQKRVELDCTISENWSGRPGLQDIASDHIRRFFSLPMRTEQL